MGLPAAQARLLGRFSLATAGGTAVSDWGRPTARRLVCLLLLAPGRRLSREQIGEALFSSLPPKRAANGVSKALTMARTALAEVGLDGLVESDRTNVWIAESAELDVDHDAHFDALRRALGTDGPGRAAALREALLHADDVLVADDPYEDWALVARRGLEELRAEARAALAREEPVDGVGAKGTFGRRVELARLTDLLEQRGGAAVVTGPAGIGKSHVLDALAERFRARGRRVLTAAAIAEDHRVPFAALRTALRPLRQTADSPLVDRLLDGEPLPRAGTMLELASDVSDLLEASAPLLLVLDDVQWADGDFQLLLTRLAALPRDGWSLLLAARTDEPGSTAVGFPPSFDRIELRPLPRGPLEQLVRSAATEAGQATGARRVRALALRSGGNPFFALELARQPDAERLPETIASLLLERVARASDDGRGALELVVVAGDDASYELVLAAGASAAAVEELLDSLLLVEQGTGVRAIHPLEREAVVSTLGGLRRGELHTVVADTLERLAGDTFAIARHRLAALETSGLRAYAAAAARGGIDAGLRARTLLADDVARELLEAGLAALDQATELDPQRAFAGRFALGEVHADHGRLEAAATELERALALAETDEDRGRAWSAVAGIPYRRGDWHAAAAAYERGLAAAAGSPPVRARLASDLAWMWHRLGTEGAADELRAAAEELEALGEWSSASRALDRLAVALSEADPEAALAASERAFAACARTGDAREVAALHVHRALILDLAGRHGEALADVEAAAAVYRSHGTLYMRSILHRTEAKVREHLDDLEGALAARDAEIRLLRRVDNARHLADAHEHRARLLAAIGDGAAAAAARAEAERAAGKSAGIDSS